MVTIVYSTHKDKTYNNLFQNHLKNTIGLSNYEILEFQNNNEYSLAQIYNKGIDQSKFDIVVCIHNDIELEKGWGKKLIKDFQNNPNYGIIGKAGSCYFPESGVYWERLNQTMVGQVYHHPVGQKKWLSKYSPKFDFLIPVVTIDGLFIAFDKTKIKHKFDETIGKFHFYDHGFCVPNYLDGIKLGVTTSFEITHQSIGRPNNEFFESKDKFVEKYKSVLPLDLKPSSIFVEKVKRFSKKTNKTAIIIPHKNNFDLLIDCLNSWVDNCDINIFDIFLADTGSTLEEREKIQKFMSNYPTWKYIQYEFYNFAKINNDVVRNHVSNDYEFLIFCNNDISLLNDVLSVFLTEVNKNHTIGSLGPRLHYEDNTVQHDGLNLILRKEENKLIANNKNAGAYFNFSKTPSTTIGNTGALLFIRKSVFEKVGMFNEKYEECFEDVELSLSLILSGRINVTCGNAVAIHKESKTRSLSTSMSRKAVDDANNNLIPFINTNLTELRKKMNNI